MAQSIETLANAFSVNSNDETCAMRVEINEIKKDMNDTKKSIDGIKTLLLQVINK